MSAAAAAEQFARPPLGWLTARPIVALVLCLAGGIAVHDRVPAHAPVLLFIVVAALLTIVAAVLLRRAYVGSILLATALLCAGIAVGRLEHFQFRSDDVAHFAGDEPRFGGFRLRLIDEPRILSGAPGARPLPPRQVVPAEVVAVRTWGGWRSASGSTVLQLNEIDPQLAPAQQVEVFARIARPLPAMNPGQFDWAEYYRQQRELVSLVATRAADVHVLDSPAMPPLLWLRLKVRHLLATGFTASQSVDHALLRAMLLGDRDPQLSDVEDQFRRTGLAYQLSVSGLHIGILVGIVAGLCRLARVRPGRRLLIAAAVAVLYVTVALPGFSAVRWLILSLAILTALWLRREADRPQMIALAALAILLWHPLDLFSIGFQLSFAVVIALALLLPLLQTRWAELRDPDRVVLERMRPPGKWVQLRRRALQWFAWSAQITVVAWMVTLPLAARDFGKVGAWALLAGPVLLPVVVLCLLAGAGKVLLTLAWPVAAGGLAVGAVQPVRLLRWAVALLAKLPGSGIALAAPPIWLVILYELLLILPLLPKSLIGRRTRRIFWTAPPIALAAILFLPLIPTAPAASGTPANSLRITLLSLGAGQSAVIEPPGHQLPELFDAGSSTVTNLVGTIVSPFLSVEGQTSLDRIFLSHGDYDHISAAGELAESYDAKQVLVSPHFRPNAIASAADERLLAQLERINLSPALVSIGDHVNLGGGAVVSVLWPPPAAALNSNNAGLVLRLTYAGRSILFPADIQDPGFAGVLRNAPLLKSDVLVAAHHGSSEPLTSAFLRAVSPRFIISSNAARLTSKQKRFNEIVGATPLFRTSVYGAITVTITSDGKITLDTFLKGRQHP